MNNSFYLLYWWFSWHISTSIVFFFIFNFTLTLISFCYQDSSGENDNMVQNGPQKHIKAVSPQASSVASSVPHYWYVGLIWCCGGKHTSLPNLPLMFNWVEIWNRIWPKIQRSKPCLWKCFKLLFPSSSFFRGDDQSTFMP